MLTEARKDLGMVGRPNQITRDYASRNGDVFLRAAWCAMSLTHWARQSGSATAVLPKGDRAYTVWHAEDGRDLGRWHAGTAANIRSHARPGAVVFFDWDGTDSISRIDHVGIVEENLGDGRVQTIEGNTGDACKRRVRGPSVIAGFWNPPYEEDDMPSAKEVADEVVERLTYTLSKDLWAVREGIFPEGQKIDPRTAFRQIWAYGKDGYAKNREILAKLEAHDATIRALVEALASKDGAVDVEALIARIRQEIEGITLRLDTGPADS
jgi:hypothetical protein